MSEKPSYDELKKKITELEGKLSLAGQKESFLQQKSDWFQDIAENISEVFWVGSPDWQKVHYISHAYEEVWGRTCESLYENPASWLDAVDTEDRQKVLATIENKSSGDLADVNFPEYRVIRPDGSIRWIHARAYPIYDEQGKVKRIAGIAEDITKRKQAEENLIISEEKYRSLFTNEIDAISIFDIETKEILDINDSFLKLYGYTREEALRLTTDDVSAEPEKTREAINKSARDGDALIKRRRHKKKNGDEIIVNISAGPFKWQGRNVMFAIMRDITDHVKAEKKLLELENRFSIAFQASPDSININKMDGTFVQTNDGFTELTGYTQEDVVGKTSLDINIWENPEDRVELIEGLKKEGQVVNLESRFRLKDGSCKIALMSANIIQLNGEPHILSITRDITDRKKIETDLKESQGYLQAILDNTTSPIFLKDTAGKYLLINQQYGRLAHTTEDEIKGKDDFEIFPEPVATLFKEQDNQVKNENRPLDFEETIPLPDGEHTFITTKFPLHDDNDSIYAVGGLCIDITKRIKSEKSLRDNEQLLNSIFRSAPIGIGLVINRVFHWTNEKISEITGYSKVELKNQSSRMLYPTDEEFKWVGDKKYELINEHGTGSVETRWQRKDGKIIDILLSSTPLALDDLSKGVTFTALDITERKQAVKALADSEERYREIYNDTSDVIFIHDAETGKIVDVNQAVTEIYGYTIEEAKNLTLEDFSTGVPPYTLKEANKKIADAATSGPQVFEWHAKKKNGEMFWVEVALKFAEFSGKRNVIAVVRDISDRKQVEEELIKIRKLESVGVLAGGIAHDFNNILASILGNISLAALYVKPENEKAKNLLHEAEKASLRAKDLTQQLLTFSKGGEPVKQVASIAAVIKDSASFVLRGSNSKCEYSFSEDLWPVEIDTGQMSQVIQNIIINASHAMPEGGIIDISCENFVKDEKQPMPLAAGNYVKISISDKGIGIPAHMLEKIFDPYFTTKQEGSGLGLAITHSIIVQHGGYITVESEQGIGSTFMIYLSATDQHNQTDDEDTSPLQIKDGRKILLMEDEKIVREIAHEILTHLGCDVVLAKDGEEAIEIYRQLMATGKAVDLVIMDLTVPGGMGGKESIEKLLEIDPQVKVIVASGYSNDPVMANYSDYGFKGVISKPFLINELSEVIN
jgi:PAS domain S-box-containing protein